MSKGRTPRRCLVDLNECPGPRIGAFVLLGIAARAVVQHQTWPGDSFIRFVGTLPFASKGTLTPTAHTRPSLSRRLGHGVTFGLVVLLDLMASSLAKLVQGYPCTLEGTSIDHSRNRACGRGSRRRHTHSRDHRRHPGGDWRDPLGPGLHGPRRRRTQALLLTETLPAGRTDRCAIVLSDRGCKSRRRRCQGGARPEASPESSLARRSWARGRNYPAMKSPSIMANRSGSSKCGKCPAP